MNEFDIVESGYRLCGTGQTPNLGHGTEILHNLMDWTNDNSDGWPYWVKPRNAAKGLMEAVSKAAWEDQPEDITEAELARLCRPIKAFLTRQGVDHSEVF